MGDKEKKEILKKLQKTNQISQKDISEVLNDIHDEIDENEINKASNFIKTNLITYKQVLFNF